MRSPALATLLLSVALGACADEEQLGQTTGAAGTSGQGGSAGASGGSGQCEPDPGVAEQTFTKINPVKGTFTLDEALAGLPEGPGPLRAIITTDKGALTCTLRPDVAPVGVANFVGLARGTRPFRDVKSKKFRTGRFYDGLLFHRVIPGFVAQGGDPLGTGAGGPGYAFANEVGSLTHEPGALAYANSGPGTNGSQFYVVEEAQPDLDGDYTVFGLCTPVSVVTALTSVPTDENDRPLTDLHIQRVDITRCAP